MNTPVQFRWSGEAMEPLDRYRLVCNKQFVVGEVYPFVVHQDRSSQSHRHYFSCVADAFANLPQHLAEQFPSSEHLRKYALIKAGYCDKRSVVCKTTAEAERVIGFAKPIDSYAVIFATGCVVTICTAHSQSNRSMDRKTFQKSKDKVLDVLADMLGVDPAAMREEAGRAA